MTILRAVDVETTGLGPDDKIVEIGWTTVRFDEGFAPEIILPVSVLVNPHRPISIEAMAVHHITDEEAATGIEADAALERALDGVDVLVAHVAKFEQQHIKTDKPWICTWKVACHHAPHAPSHSLQALRYWLKLMVDPTLAEHPHRAGPDSYVTALLIARMLARFTIAEMIEISSRPCLLPRFRFGKHVGKPIAEIPKDYLEWMLRQDFDEDVKYTASYYLERCE